MYAGRVTCCPLVSNVEYAPTMYIKARYNTGQTDGRTDSCHNENNQHSEQDTLSYKELLLSQRDSLI